MLTNTTLKEPQVDNVGGKVLVSLYVDNWSPYNMQHTKSQSSGEFLVKAQDLGPKARSLALRDMAERSPSTAGIACWVLTSKHGKVSRLCVAWDVGNGQTTTIAASIGEKAPRFEGKTLVSMFMC